MYFLIDGYNLLFSGSQDKRSLEMQRSDLLIWVHKHFDQLCLSGLIVFDGSSPFPNEVDLSYRSPLEIAYTSKGQTADAYIVERLCYLKNPVTLVTNDRGLLSHCREFRIQVMSSESFIRWLLKKTKTKQHKASKHLKQSAHQVNQWVKMFEERLKTGESSKDI